MKEKNEKKQTIRQQLKSGSDWNIRPYLAMGLTFFIVFCCCILVVCVFFRFQELKDTFSMFISIAQPILFGLAIGYLINPIMMFFERIFLKLADKKGIRDKIRRPIRTVSSILAVLVFILIIAMLLSMVIPQVFANISHLVDTMPAQMNSFIVHLNEWEFGNHKIMAMLEEYLVTVADWTADWLRNSLLPQTKDYVATITSGVINVLVAFKNIVIGLVVSIYVMCEKENFEGQAKKIIFALFPARAANQVIQVFHTTNEIFGGFIKGKLLDSLIIGIICYIVLLIIKMPYTLLVSVIVGITNIIPFFGPFIGAIPSAFLILLVDPLYALYFLIFVVILQQVDGNIIGPKILGDSTGLSSFWVMFAILVGSGMFGVMGMLLGCPVFAVIYYIIERTVHFFLEKKGLPMDTGVYIEATGVEPAGRQLWYGRYADEKKESAGKDGKPVETTENNSESTGKNVETKGKDGKPVETTENNSESTGKNVETKGKDGKPVETTEKNSEFTGKNVETKGKNGKPVETTEKNVETKGKNGKPVGKEREVRGIHRKEQGAYRKEYRNQGKEQETYGKEHGNHEEE